MDRPSFWQRLPGYIAVFLLMVATTLWTFWSIGEFYYEGWGVDFPLNLVYLIPGTICILFTLVALTWPRVGGWIIIVLGGAFTYWRWGEEIREGGLDLEWALSWFPVSAMLVLIGVLFLLEARLRRRQRQADQPPPSSWLRRNLRYVVALTPPLLAIIGASIYYVPTLISRQDDGGRGARLVEGNGVTLVWAPLGPGWNWKQEWGGYPSWNSLAFYGVPPLGLDPEDKPAKYQDQPAGVVDMRTTGLCRYLGDDGLTLMDEPQDIWRMPTTDELVRSLTLHGENAGCTWDGLSEQADCRITPDKETPLWAPDQAPIYYWTADAYSREEAHYVNYAGSIDWQPKRWGNPRHGYRCVREP
ncbi:MAG: hypothetical protein JXA37_01770 [Chloroflexia bacterium]|nr:hypothetical protein [Chloroflexia bacterium]